MLFLIVLASLFIILFISFGFSEVIDFLWLKIEKIGALATALALIFAIKQGQIAQKAARNAETSNQENLFQQSFNLILEQHNTEMRSVIEWLSKMESVKTSDNKNYKIFEEKSTDRIVILLHGHNKLSPYMRLLHHTLKTIKLKYGTTPISQNQFLDCKRYSSLVRSFIPNELLYLIALNALTINESFGENTDYKQYKDYYTNLVYFDFFEHLIIKKENITFNEFIVKLESKLIEDVLAQVSSTIINNSTDGENDLIVTNTNIHTRAIDYHFSKPDFCIAIYYNHPEKYLTIDDSYIPKKTFKQNIESRIDNFFMSDKKNNSFETFSIAFNHFIRQRISFIFDKQHKCEISPKGTLQTYIFLPPEESEIIGNLCESINLNQSINNLTDLKNNIYQVITKLLDSYSKKFLQDEPHIYQEHYNKTRTVFCENLHILIEKTIKTKKYLSNRENIESLSIQKRQEMKNRFNFYLSGVN